MMRVLVITNLYPTDEEPSFGTFVKNQVEDLRRLGVEIDVLFINGRKHKWHYLLGPFRLWARLLRRRYHLIHCHYIFSGIIGRLQWLYPVVVTHHGIEIIDGSWVSALAKKAHPWFNRVIVVNQQLKEELNDPNIAVIPCGINLNQMKPMPQAEARAALNLPPDKKLILWAGEHWRPEKRFHLVEAAVKRVQLDMPEAELVLVSGQPHSVIPYYMNACDVLVLTSTHEGSPMVIKEAMACNLPVVSTDVGDVAQVIEGVEGCYLCRPDVEDIAEKILRVLRWGRRTNGREKIWPLSAEFAARQIVDVYNQLCPPSARLELPPLPTGNLTEQGSQ